MRLCRIRFVSVIAIVAVLGAAGCSSSRRGGSALAAATTVVPSSAALVETTTTQQVAAVPVTVAVVDTLVPAPTSTSVSSPATVAPPVTLSGTDDPLLLRSDGFGRFAFQTPVNDVLVGVPSALGAPTSDVLTEYPGVLEALHVNADSSIGFTEPVGREVCWAEFCLEFGGADAASLTLKGWTYQSSATTPTLALKDVNGITLTSRWSDFLGAMQADPGGCYQVGGGATNEGVILVLQGGVFGQFTAAGAYEALLPDPSEVTVMGMSAGDQLSYLDSDC